MNGLFLQIVNMSITSSYVILFVILIRFLLKKAPKIYSYMLWSLVFLRLSLPISFTSIFSLIPIKTNTIPRDILYSQTPEINSGIVAIDRVVNSSLPKADLGASANPMQIWIYLGQVIWILGIVGLIVYSVITTVKLYRALRGSKLLRDNIYETNMFEIPFVFGLLKPKIYIPFGLFPREKDYIIKHEETHIKRYDHIIKFVGFIITSIHWFNPLVWLSYFLMTKDMELSCDESVIREMGKTIKKDYSASLLRLSSGKTIVGGSPLAFGGKNTKSRIKNILNYKKPRFWVSLTAIVILILVSIALLSNPEDKELLTVEDYAWSVVEEDIKLYEDLEGPWQGSKIIDSKITRLEKIESFDNIISTPVEIWSLEYRLKPDDMSKFPLVGGMREEDGWITEDGSMGKPFLAFSREKNKIQYLGKFYPQEFGFDTLAKQEIALRIMLESNNLLGDESYPGNHLVAKFPLSTGETSQLLLSQPVKQGDDGIWVVERWMDGNGTIYHAFPDTDIKIMDYYRQGQNELDNGDKLELANPLEVALEYINSDLGQVVNKKDIEIISDASVEDFLETPVSNYIGYITKTDYEDLIHIDKVEFLGSGDEERMKELGIDPNKLDNGYYIYNPNSYPYPLNLSEDTEYRILNWNDLSDNKKISKAEFMDFLEGNNPYNSTENLLFRVSTKDGYVIKLEEQYIP